MAGHRIPLLIHGREGWKGAAPPRPTWSGRSCLSQFDRSLLAWRGEEADTGRVLIRTSDGTTMSGSVAFASPRRW